MCTNTHSCTAVCSIQQAAATAPGRYTPIRVRAYVQQYTYFSSFKEKKAQKKNTATHAEPFCSCDTQRHSDSVRQHQSHFTALLARANRKEKKNLQRMIAGSHGEPLGKQHQHLYASFLSVGDLDAPTRPIRAQPRQNSAGPHLSEARRLVPYCTFGVGKGFA